jgi:hypothetical protein
MGKALFLCHPDPTPEDLRREVDTAFSRMGESTRTILRDRVVIGTTETRIRHEGLKRWRLYSPEATSVVSQTRAPDSEFIYLIADPVEVTTGIELF